MNISPIYQKILDSGKYDCIEDLCNDLGLDFDDIVDDDIEIDDRNEKYKF